jgi:ELWxxDGT repeat protein
VQEEAQACGGGQEVQKEAPMRRWALILGFLGACVFAGNAGAAPGDLIVKQVANINPAAGNSIPTEFTDVNGTAFFRADDGTHGLELWKSDGSTATMVADIDPTPGVGSSPAELTNVAGTLYFTANDGTSGRELWKSTGTGATMVANIRPGAASSAPTDLTDLSGTVFFAADDGTNGVELWKSTGGPLGAGGTEMAADINASAGASSSPEEFTNVSGTLFFSADDGTNGQELWKSPGTGATIVADINPTAGTSSNLGRFAAANGLLFFAADNGTDGYELWKSNGGALGSGTTMVADIAPADDGNPKGMTDVNGTVFFEANNGTDGGELFKSVAPFTSAAMVADINPTGNSEPFALTAVGSTVFFAAYDGTHGTELWKSTGGPLGPGGTEMVADVNSATGVGSLPDPPLITNSNGTVFFPANDGIHGTELWKSGGTGAAMVADINPVPGMGSISDAPLTNVGGDLYFSASDGSTGLEPWRTAIEDPAQVAPSPPASTTKGQRAAALKKCKKKPPGKKRAKCKRKAKRLPL